MKNKARLIVALGFGLGLLTATGLYCSAPAQDNALPRLTPRTNTVSVTAVSIAPVDLTPAQMDGVIQAVLAAGVNDAGVGASNLLSVSVRRINEPTQSNVVFRVSIRRQ